MLNLLSTVCVFWLDMIPSIIYMYIVTFDSNEYQETTIFLLEEKSSEPVREISPLVLHSQWHVINELPLRNLPLRFYIYIK